MDLKQFNDKYINSTLICAMALIKHFMAKNLFSLQFVNYTKENDYVTPPDFIMNEHNRNPTPPLCIIHHLLH